METPSVSIIWLNFNSERSINKVKESLEGIARLNYPNFELIIVDNDSYDDSFRKIHDFVSDNGIRAKLAVTGRNLGFAGGCNWGLKYVSSHSEYIVLLNNDYVPFEESLKDLVCHMQKDRSVGQARLPELDWSGKKLQSAGHILDEVMNIYPRYRGYSPTEVRETQISYASGAYCMIRRKIVDELGRVLDNNLFFSWEDTLLSIEVWNMGYRVMCFEELGGRHHRGLTAREYGSTVNFQGFRGLGYFLATTNSRFKQMANLIYSQISLQMSLLSRQPALFRGFREGLTLGNKSERILDLYRAPIKLLGVSDIMRNMIIALFDRPLIYVLSSNYAEIFNSMSEQKIRSLGGFLES